MLRIKDLRQSDSSVYKFMFTTNQLGLEYIGNHGVMLSVTGKLGLPVCVCLWFCVGVVLSYIFYIIVCNFTHSDIQVKVSFLYPTDPSYAKLECHSMCGLAGDPRYILFRNGHYVGQGVKHWANIHSGDSFSCAVEGYERLRSPLVCKSTPHDPRYNFTFWV